MEWSRGVPRVGTESARAEGHGPAPRDCLLGLRAEANPRRRLLCPRPGAAGTPGHVFKQQRPLPLAPRRLFPSSKERKNEPPHGFCIFIRCENTQQKLFPPAQMYISDGGFFPRPSHDFCLFNYYILVIFSCPLSTATPLGDPPPALSAPPPDTSPSLHPGAKQGGERARPRTHTHTHARTRLAATQPSLRYPQ